MTPGDGLRDDIVQGASPRDVADFAVHHEAHRSLEVSYGLQCVLAEVAIWRLALPGCGSPDSSGSGWMVGQAGNGMTAMRAKAARRSSTQGQLAGNRRFRRRALRVSRAGTCSSR